MNLDPLMPALVGIFFVMALLAILARKFRQPPIVGFLIAGFLVGPSVFGIIDDIEFLSRLGAVGVILLLFFIGMEISPRQLGTNWRIAVMGTCLQIIVTTTIVIGLGYGLGWPLARSVLLGFVVSISSTAVVVKLLEDWGTLRSTVGQDVLSITIVQDLAIVPMLIVIGGFAGEGFNGARFTLQIIGGSLLIGLAVWIAWKGEVNLGLGRIVREDRELQVLMALVICFGLSLLSAILQLSAALGAFIAGMLVRSTRDEQWVQPSLQGFRVVFVALFFASIGMLMDIAFVKAYWPQLALLVLVVLIGNTVINASILWVLGRSWRRGIYGGALLSQIGEFGFVLAAVGLQANMIGNFGYQMTIAMIAVSLLLSPAWIALTKFFLSVTSKYA